jgi:hypothetical protein
MGAVTGAAQMTIEYGDWPLGAGSSGDDTTRLTKGRKRATSTTHALEGRPRRQGYAWWKWNYDKDAQRLYCTFRIGGRLQVLDKETGSKCYICDTVEEAKEFYREKISQIAEGVFDDVILRNTR